MYTGRPLVTAWRPAGVPGIEEVFHARFIDHAYPAHTHQAWTLLIVDAGVIRYDLHRHRYGASATTVTLLPPYVPHDGRSALPQGFRKRVLYLAPEVLGEDLTGAAVDRPVVPDRLLRDRIHRLHQVLARPGDEFEAQCRLALIGDRIRDHLRNGPERLAVDGSRPGRRSTVPSGPGQRSDLAPALRDLLEDRIATGISLAEAARLLHAHPAHLIRCFTTRYGLPPHRYLLGRRIEVARRLLLGGARPAGVAADTGFTDQAHLTRHFTRYLGVPPGRYARTARRAS